MEILEKTSNKLVCGTKPNLFFRYLDFFLAAFFLLLSYHFLNSSGVRELVCKKVELTQVNCELSQSRFMGLVKEQVISLSDVKKARVDTKTNITIDDDGVASHSKSYEVVILYSNNTIFLSRFPEDALKLNAFIKNNNSAELNIKNDSRLSTLAVLGIIICLLILFRFLTKKTPKTTAFIFDKSINKLTIKQQALAKDKVAKVMEYPLLEIIDVFVKTQTDDSSSLSGYHVGLSLTGNNNLFLSSFNVRAEAKQFANTIELFLNLQKKC